MCVKAPEAKFLNVKFLKPLKIHANKFRPFWHQVLVLQLNRMHWHLKNQCREIKIDGLAAEHFAAKPSHHIEIKILLDYPNFDIWDA